MYSIDDLPETVHPVFKAMEEADWEKEYPLSYYLRSTIMLAINDLPVHRMLFLCDLIAAWSESSSYFLELEFSNLLNSISPSIVIGHDESINCESAERSGSAGETLRDETDI